MERGEHRCSFSKGTPQDLSGYPLPVFEVLRPERLNWLRPKNFKYSGNGWFWALWRWGLPKDNGVPPLGDFPRFETCRGKREFPLGRERCAKRGVCGPLPMRRALRVGAYGSPREEFSPLGDYEGRASREVWHTRGE